MRGPKQKWVRTNRDFTFADKSISGSRTATSNSSRGVGPAHWVINRPCIQALQGQRAGDAGEE